MAPPRVAVPDFCSSVGPQCPVEGTLYGYAPNLGANTFMCAFFSICLIAQLYFGIRYKTWTYMIALSLGCVAECVGYIGRILLYLNAYDGTGFNIQIVLLIFAPAFIAAGIYLTLKHIVIAFGEEWSRLRPNWYTWVFILSDLTALILQSAGGAMAATADSNTNMGAIGTNIMIAGIAWQVFVLVVFGAVATEYAYLTYQRRERLSAYATDLWHNRRFRLFCVALIVAYWTILIRCIYRIPELAAGWASNLMREEVPFILLEGIMIAIAVGVLTIFHPGLFFPALANTIGKKAKAARAAKA